MTARKLTAALVAGLLVLPAIVKAEELPLDVMTFNIRFGTAYDRENNWPNRQDMVVRMLQKYDADIVGTQEIQDFQADYITRWMPEYRWFGAHRGDHMEERCAILYKWREYMPLGTGTFWLSETPAVYASQSWDAALPRIATWARFVHMETETEFYVYNTHFDHVGRQARVHSMDLILEHIDENARDRPVILLGDFNVTAEQSEVYDAVAETGFEDLWLTAAGREGPTATWNAFRDLDPESDRRIDWIMTRGPFEADYIETIIYSEDGRWPSDHFPVFARVRLDISE